MPPHIELIVGVGGPDFAWAPGEVVDLPEEEAAKWADGERARRRPDLDGPPRETTHRPDPVAPQPSQPQRETTDGRPRVERADLTRPNDPDDVELDDDSDADETPVDSAPADVTESADVTQPEDPGGEVTTAPAPAAVPVPPKSGHGSGAHAWRVYAESLGVTVPDGAKRDDIVELLDGAQLPTE
jgi:hypothetical protein